MEKLFIDPSWTFNQAVEHLEALRLQYEEVLASFLWWQLKERNTFIRGTRNSFYALNLLEWQIDRMWNYMNGFDFLSSIKECAKRYK